jgi:hypothetical protein
MNTLRVIVAGGRGFDSYLTMAAVLSHLFSKAITRGDDITIISGTARGADQKGELYAARNQLKCDKYPADWDNHGRSAGYKRNTVMADNATHLVAFWDGVSRGTKHMIDIARAKGLIIRVYDYNGHVVTHH